MSESGRQHLAETGLSYGGHLCRAWAIGGRLIGAGAACLVHGVFPAVLRTRASETVLSLGKELKSAPARRGEPMLIEFEI